MTDVLIWVQNVVLLFFILNVTFPEGYGQMYLFLMFSPLSFFSIPSCFA